MKLQMSRSTGHPNGTLPGVQTPGTGTDVGAFGVDEVVGKTHQKNCQLAFAT